MGWLMPKNGCHQEEGDRNFQSPPARSSYGGQARHPKLVSFETAQGGRGGGPLRQGYVD